MRFLLAILACLLTACSTQREPMRFGVYHLTSDGRTLIAQGKLDYTVQDIHVAQWGCNDGHPTWNKSLKLKNGFSIGVLVTRADDVPGLGLWIRNGEYPAGFSWEWFTPESGEIYKKLQGEGRLRVTQSRFPDGVEVRSVEFLSDITLRFQEDVKMGPGKHTHEIVVSKGSVLRVST